MQHSALLFTSLQITVYENTSFEPFVAVYMTHLFRKSFPDGGLGPLGSLIWHGTGSQMAGPHPVYTLVEIYRVQLALKAIRQHASMRSSRRQMHEEVSQCNMKALGVLDVHLLLLTISNAQP